MIRLIFIVKLLINILISVIINVINQTGALEAKPGDNHVLDFYAGQIFKNIQLHTLDAYSPDLENIQNDLRKALEGNKGKPLTVAMDTTMDFQNSWAIKDLLKTFASEIKDGKM